MVACWTCDYKVTGSTNTQFTARLHSRASSLSVTKRYNLVPALAPGMLHSGSIWERTGRLPVQLSCVWLRVIQNGVEH